MNTEIDEMIEDYVSTLNSEYIDSFRVLVARSVDEEFADIDSRYERHQSREYDDAEKEYINRTWIEDDAIYMGDVSTLAQELSIVALYKLFEKKHKDLIRYHTGDGDSKKYSYWSNVMKVLPDNAKSLNSFKSVNELRLLNNSIKHEGVVSDDLYNDFPQYGLVGDELSDIGQAFDRLKPEIIKYISELHHEFKIRKT